MAFSRTFATQRDGVRASATTSVVTKTRAGTRARRRASPQPPVLNSVETHLATARDDEELVVRCLKNDRQAWNTLFTTCHPRIVARLCMLLGRRSNSLEIAHEIAAQVWLSLVADEGRALRHYNAGNGARLFTYLNGIAVRHGLLYLRKSRRRLRHEVEYVLSAGKQYKVGLAAQSFELREFTRCLTPREVDFFTAELLPGDGTPAALPLTVQNAWQLRHRIRRKLLRYVREEL